MGIDYKAFVDAANTDDRIGQQTFSVTGNQEKTVNWEGGAFQVREVSGILVTAGGANIRMDFGTLPSDEEMARLEAGIKSKTLSADDRKKVMAVGKSLEMRDAIKAATGKAVEELTFGDEFRVEIVKNKQGYLRVGKVLGKVGDAPDFNAAGKPAGKPGF